MITTPTTFVIGAGASKDYGLPISSDLRKEAHGLLPQHSVYQLIHEAGLPTAPLHWTFFPRIRE